MGERQPFRFRMPWFTTVSPPRSTEPSARPPPPPPRRPPFRPAGIAPATQTQAPPPQQPTERKTPVRPPPSSLPETQNKPALNATAPSSSAPQSSEKVGSPPRVAAETRMKPASPSRVEASTPPVVVQPVSPSKKPLPAVVNEPLQGDSDSNSTRLTEKLAQESQLKSESLIPESRINKPDVAKHDEERMKEENKELVLLKNQKEKEKGLKIQEEKKDQDLKLAVQDNKKDPENEDAKHGITRLLAAGLDTAKGAREALETKIQALKAKTQETQETPKKKDQDKESVLRENQKDQENSKAERGIPKPLAAGLDSTKGIREALDIKNQDLKTEKQETKKDQEKESAIQENKKDREIEDVKRRILKPLVAGLDSTKVVREVLDTKNLETKEQETKKKDQEKEPGAQQNKKDQENEEGKRRIPKPLAAGSDSTKGPREEVNSKIQSQEVSRGNNDQFKTLQPTHQSAYRQKPGSNSINSHQNPHGPNGEKPSLSKEIQESVNKMVEKVASGHPNKSFGEKPVSVVTVAGDNKGATMNIGLDSSKKDGSVHIRRGYKSNPDESPYSTTEPEGSSSKGKNLKESNQDTPIRAYINNNVQSVNNSITFDSSVNERNPGVHMVFRVGKGEPGKVETKPGTVETKKAEIRVMPAEKVTYEPRVRRRCLRGLFLEPSDSDPDNPEKPRRHGCRYSCGDKGKDKDIGIF